jgi:hypothetical protein
MGMFDVGIDPVVAAQVQAEKDAQANALAIKANVQQGYTRPDQRFNVGLGVDIGRFLGKLIGGGSSSDPSVEAAKQSVGFAKQLAELGSKYDPASSEYATEATKLALAQNRPDLAVQFSQVAGARKKEEAKTAAAAQQQNIDNARQAFSALGTDGQLAMLSIDPASVKPLFPGITDENLMRLSEEAKATSETRRLTNLKKLNEIKAVHASDVSKQDGANAVANMQTMGVVPATFGGFGQDELNTFGTTLAGQVKAEQDAAAARGETLSPSVIQSDLMQALEKSGGITVRKAYGTDGTVITGIDKSKLNDVFKSRLDSMAAQSKSTSKDTATSDKQAAMDWVKANPTDPRVANIRAHFGF